jgi:hypothetical protein
MAVEGFEFQVPSADADRKQLKVMIEEAVGTMIRCDGERDHKKEIVAAIREQFKIDASILNKVIAMRHKQTFTTVEAKQEATSELYTVLFGDNEKLKDDQP